MPNLSGLITPSATFDNATLWTRSVDISSFGQVNFATAIQVTYAMRYLMGGGVANLPVLHLTRSATGQYKYLFGHDWYNRIHVNPSSVGLGNIISQVTKTVEVWNAYFTPELLSQVVEQGTSGMTLTGPQAAPTTFGSLQSRIYTLTVDLQGSANIAASYAFQFPSESPALTVTGARLLTWRYLPDWKGGITDSYEWLTDVMTAYDGTEQRVQLRKFPRQILEYEAVALDAQRLKMMNEARVWQSRKWAVPIWTDGRKLTADASIGDTRLYLDTTQAQFEVGGFIGVLSDDVLTSEAGTIQNVQPTYVDLALPIGTAWKKTTRVYPLRVGTLHANETYSKPTIMETRLRAQFTFDSSKLHFTPSELGSTYLGYPVLEGQQHNWLESMQMTIDHKMQEYDYLIGKKYWEFENNTPTGSYELAIPLTGRDQINAFKSWLHARAGRLTPFWMPLPDHAFFVTQPIAANGNAIFVKNLGFTDMGGPQQGRRDIRIELMNGTTIYTRITSSTVIDQTTERLLVADQFVSTIDPASIRKLTFMTLSRVDADKVDFAWITPTLANVKVRVREIVSTV